MTIFIGQTLTGKRWHIGNWVSPRHTRRETWVYTFCGSEMRSWDEETRPRSDKVDDLCRICFRAYAWQVLVESVGKRVLPTLDAVYAKQVAPSRRLQEEHDNAGLQARDNLPEAYTEDGGSNSRFGTNTSPHETGAVWAAGNRSESAQLHDGREHDLRVHPGVRRAQG